MIAVIEAWNATGRELSDTIEGDHSVIYAVVREYERRGFNNVTIHRLDVVCDFCSDPSVCAIFQIEPGGDMGTLVVDGKAIGHSDRDGKWGACAACKRLIEAERWDKLAARAMHAIPEIFRDEIGQAIVSGPHGCFRRGYKGDPAMPVVSDHDLMNEKGA